MFLLCVPMRPWRSGEQMVIVCVFVDVQHERVWCVQMYVYRCASDKCSFFLRVYVYILEFAFNVSVPPPGHTLLEHIRSVYFTKIHGQLW